MDVGAKRCTDMIRKYQSQTNLPVNGLTTPPVILSQNIKAHFCYHINVDFLEETLECDGIQNVELCLPILFQLCFMSNHY